MGMNGGGTQPDLGRQEEISQKKEISAEARWGCDKGIGLAAEGAVRASGEVFKGLVNDVMKCKHYPKGRKEPLKGFKDTKCLCLEI